MSKLLYATISDPNIGPSLTRFYALGSSGVLANATTEVAAQRTQRVVGRYSSFYVKISANTLTGSSTIRTRKNGANGNMSVSVSAGSTGEFRDTTNTDSVVAGDEINYQGITGTGTSLSIRAMSVLFDPNGGSINTLNSSRAAQNLSVASTAYYYNLGGQLQNASGTVEAESNTRMRTTLRFSNMQIYVATNARGTATTMRFRKNAANGNMNISVTASTTGIFEDISNADTVVSGDDVCYSITTGTGAGNFATTNISSTQESFIGHHHWIASNTTDYSLAAGATIFQPICGGLFGAATESDFAHEALEPVTISNIQTYVRANASATTVTVRLRKNATDANSAISVTALTTGLFTDSTNIDSFSSTDEFNYRMSGGTTGAVNFENLSCLARYNYPPFLMSLGVGT